MADARSLKHAAELLTVRARVRVRGDAVLGSVCVCVCVCCVGALTRMRVRCIPHLQTHEGPQMMLRSALQFAKGAAMQETSLRSRAGDAASAEQVAQLFCQTGSLCDHAAGRADELLRALAQKKPRYAADRGAQRQLLLLRLLGFRLSIVCSARAMGLRRKVRVLSRARTPPACT